MVHHMNLLSQEGSCELLLKTASRGYSHSRDYEVDEELHQIAMEIVRQCQGLPLAIGVIGGLLARTHTAREWRMVLQGLDSYLNPDQSSQGATDLDLYSNKEKGSQEISKMSAIFSLSYDALPNHLKPCFLYIGAFSEVGEIKANRLISLWLAEGMISSRDRESNMTLEDIAEGYLYELAIRNLVLVKEKEVPTIRRFKSCHLHHLVRELCFSKLNEEKFFDVTRFERTKNGNLVSYPPFMLALYFKDECVVPHNSSTDKYLWPLSFCKLCEYQQEFTSPVRVLNLIGTFKVLRSQPPIVQLRTLQFSSLRDLPQASSDLRCFRRLSVLDINGFDFNKTRFPKGIEMLPRLRFLRLEYCNITQLPSSICSLANLEALYLRKCPGIIIPNELQKLRRLKYLHLPRSYRVPGVDKLQLDELRELQSLKNFDSGVCKGKDLLKLTKLRKLVARIEENFEDLVEIIKCIKNLRYLRHCSLVVRRFDHNLREEYSVAFNLLFASPNLHVLHIHGHLDNLPLNISQSLTKISFSGSELNEDPMGKLEKLPHLWFLALSNGAFLGKHISCSASGMPRLKCLTLSNLQNLENLTVQEGAMPKLSTLAIESCQKLVQLPEGLSSLTSLQRLMVTWMPPAFIDRIHEGAKDFHKVKHVPFIRIRSWPSQTTKAMPPAFQMSCWKVEKIFEN